MIGRLHHVIIDCPDPAALASFYSALLGLPITWQQADFVVVSKNDTTSGIAFQLAPDLQRPQWPDPAGRSRCTSMSWSMTSKPPNRRSWRSVPADCRATTKVLGSTKTRPGIRSA